MSTVTKGFILALVLMSMLLLIGCGGSTESKWQDGTYTGEGEGNNGPVKVNVVIKSGKIDKVEVVEHKETPGICDVALERIPKAIIEKQSVEGVDTVSGATRTSKAIIEAVKSALEQAANE
ncbi:MAG: FMN-binding protein [Thermosediminibacteraceae bacterium]|nr:FMN-binding protein [Thermosediminibacteraceae bacterium]